MDQRQGPCQAGSAKDPIELVDDDELIGSSSSPPCHETKRPKEQRGHKDGTPSKRQCAVNNVAPIQLFRTRQMEAIGHRDNTTSLRTTHSTECRVDQTSLDRWRKACQTDDGSSTRFHSICLKPSDPPRSTNNPLSIKIPYGVHHSKFFLVGYYDNTLRVVIHTANLVYGDLHLKADAAYVQDFPLKQSSTIVKSTFETDLVGYMQSYHYTKRHVWGEEEAPLTIAQVLGRYDFSSAKALLIPSIPGYHRGGDVHRLGHMKLRRVVKHNSRDSRTGAVVCQFSSMGSISEKWLKHEFAVSATATENTSSSIKLVFPTAREVCHSVEGYIGGGSLPADTKNVQKPFLRPLFHKWTSNGDRRNPVSLGRNLPHIKTFYRYNNTNDGMQWFLLTSHNISSSAWGQLQKSGQQLFIRHWELGVFFSADTLSCRRLVPLSVDGLGSPNDVAVPLPYNFHPEKYAAGDEPWAWDKAYATSDSFGRRGLRY